MSETILRCSSLGPPDLGHIARHTTRCLERLATRTVPTPSQYTGMGLTQAGVIIDAVSGTAGVTNHTVRMCDRPVVLQYLVARLRGAGRRMEMPYSIPNGAV